MAVGVIIYTSATATVRQFMFSLAVNMFSLAGAVT
jgi:hypothetical protein